MDIYEFIDPGLLIAVPVLYVLGMMIKKSPVNDKYIPIILGLIGILLAFSYKLASAVPEDLSEATSLVFTSLTQGILCAACSVYANNILKQFTKGAENDTFKDSEKSD